MTSQQISLAILAKMQNGMTVKQAIDAVLGEGTSAKIIDDLYDALRA